jgi:diaminopropionate ammonia-lyase family
MSLQLDCTKPIQSRLPTWTRTSPPGPSISNTDSTAQHAFHKALAGYKPTALLSLDNLARSLGLSGLYMKDESSRFGLPSFKASGASWGCFRALVSRFNLDSSTATLEAVSALAVSNNIRLLAATDGNHGRAIAWMASLLGIESTIYVPHDLHPNFMRLIVAEGAALVVVDGDYDTAVATAAAATSSTNILIQDTAFDNYTDTPSWIIDGYATIFSELDQQLKQINAKPTTIVTPVGVGSLAHAAIVYAKGSSSNRNLTTIAVEPEAAACLLTSLATGSATPTSITTSHTINSGCNCGTLSSISWPYMRDHVDISTTVTDWETHVAVQQLLAQGVSSGPCGAIGFAALKKLIAEGGVREGDSVVLINTEAARPYDVPRADVDGAVGLERSSLPARLDGDSLRAML